MTRATAAALNELSRFLLKETGDRKLARKVATDIHPPICMFGHHQKDSLTMSPGKAVRPLERLERTAKTGGARWDSAWNNLTPAARQCLISGNAGKPVPVPAGVPKPEQIAPLIPGALAFAKKRGKDLSERRHVLINVLRAFRAVYGKDPTAKTAPAFIGKIEGIYADLLPLGFNVHSVGTLHSLIVESRR